MSFVIEFWFFINSGLNISFILLIFYLIFVLRTFKANKKETVYLHAKWAEFKGGGFFENVYVLD
jgi:hypothetical protein